MDTHTYRTLQYVDQHISYLSNNTNLLVICIKAADPTMLEAVSKPELPTNILTQRQLYQAKFMELHKQTSSKNQHRLSLKIFWFH